MLRDTGSPLQAKYDLAGRRRLAAGLSQDNDNFIV